MFSKIIFLFILEVAIVPLILSQTSEDVDQIVDFCVKTSQLFSRIEDKFTRKHERGRKEPDLFEPQIKELKFVVYDKELRQRPFECITNALPGIPHDVLLQSSKYQDLVSTCMAGQFRPQCDPNYPFRTIDGTCNNLDHPTWGAVLSSAKRLLPAHYEGAADFRKSVCGNDLPDPRFISKFYHTDEIRPMPFTSSHFVYFGQFIAHDLGDAPVTFVGDKHLDCCSNLEGARHPQCAPIFLRKFDFFNIFYNFTCQNYIRTAMYDTCSVGPRIHTSEPTAYLDLSLVYGITENEANKLRKLDGSGQLRVQETESGDLLPADETIPGFRCGGITEQQNSSEIFDQLLKVKSIEGAAYLFKSATFAKDGEKCFKAGDRRANQHVVITSYHTVFVREHNRIATKLKELNPHWSEEKLYQEARKINIAQYQVIVYREFLPHFLLLFMTDYDLSIKDTNTRTKYDPSVDATLVTEFSTAAYRLHSMIDLKISLFGSEGFGSSYLRNEFQDSLPLYSGKLKDILTRLGTWPYQIYDKHVTSELSHYLYREPEGDFGFDLAAVNILRGRDNGLPPYVDVIKYFSDGKVDIKDFDELFPYIGPENILRLKLIYCDVRDIDLWVGLNSELKLESIISSTAAKIIAETFRKLKYGDRFYFEHEGQFSDDQLETLKHASLSKVMCQNADICFIPVDSINFPFITNPHLPCKLLPEVDLVKWKEV